MASEHRLAGPELAAAGATRWLRMDLAQRIKARFGVTLDVRSAGRLLRKLGFRRISVRPGTPEATGQRRASSRRLRWVGRCRDPGAGARQAG